MDIGQMKHKEFGSDFYYPVDTEWTLADGEPSNFSTVAYELYFSGRSALYHLLKQGIATQAWKEVYLPSYYCHEVYRFIKTLPIVVQYYSYNPILPNTINWSEIPDRSDTVFVNTSFFGMKTLDVSSLQEAMVIEDLTHNLALIEFSVAPYCFGSLRKELPVGVGGFCFSPKGFELPKAELNIKADAVAAMKIDAMRKKLAYLKGEDADKDSYRALFSEAEHQFEQSVTQAGMPALAKQQLFTLDVKAILARKADNLAHAMEVVKEVDEIKLFEFDGTAPSFGLVFQCESGAVRDALRGYLIQNQVFPAVLWPDQNVALDRHLEDTLLFIHVDFRYTPEDISEITTMITRYFAHA